MQGGRGNGTGLLGDSNGYGLQGMGQYLKFWVYRVWVRGDIANGQKMGRNAAECIWLTSSIWVVMLADMAKERLDSYESRRPAILQVLWGRWQQCKQVNQNRNSFWIRMALIPCQNRVNFLIYSSPNRRIYIGIQAMMIRYETSTRSHKNTAMKLLPIPNFTAYNYFINYNGKHV